MSSIEAMLLRPPCWPEGTSQPNKCASKHYAQQVYGEFHLTQEFTGWRIKGGRLIAPGGRKLTVQQLRKLAEMYGTTGGANAEIAPLPRVLAAAPPADPVATCRRCDAVRDVLPLLERALAIPQSAHLANGSSPSAIVPPGNS